MIVHAGVCGPMCTHDVSKDIVPKGIAGLTAGKSVCSASAYALGENASNDCIHAIQVKLNQGHSGPNQKGQPPSDRPPLPLPKSSDLLAAPSPQISNLPISKRIPTERTIAPRTLLEPPVQTARMEPLRALRALLLRHLALVVELALADGAGGHALEAVADQVLEAADALDDAVLAQHGHVGDHEPAVPLAGVAGELADAVGGGVGEGVGGREGDGDLQGLVVDFAGEVDFGGGGRVCHCEGGWVAAGGGAGSVLRHGLLGLADEAWGDLEAAVLA